jgi:hypothetical protein
MAGAISPQNEQNASPQRRVTPALRKASPMHSAQTIRSPSSSTSAVT